MLWPEWPKLPQFEFPPKELPVFLHPLRLIPHYKRQVGGAIRSFLQRDDNRLFGPVEQFVTAAVILGLGEPSFPSGYLDSAEVTAIKTGQTPPHIAATHTPLAGPMVSHQNDTTSPALQGSATAAAALPLAASISSPHLVTGSATLDLAISLLFSLATWVKQHLDMTTILVALLAVNVILLVIPHDVKKNIKTSWDLFWPPWQDRTPATTSTPHHPDDSTVSRETKIPEARSSVAVAEKKMREASVAVATPEKKMREAKSEPSASRSRGLEASGTDSAKAAADVSAQAKAPSVSAEQQAIIAKEMERVKREMAKIKADETMGEEEKVMQLKVLDGKRQKLKAKLASGQPGPEKSGDTSVLPERSRAVDAGSSDQQQLEKLKVKMAAVQADSRLSEEQKAAKMSQYEKMKRQLKGKGKEAPRPVSTPGQSTASRDHCGGITSDQVTTRSSEGGKGATAPPSPDPEEQKQLERLKAKMIAVKADTTLSDEERTKKLAELDSRRRKLKVAQQASAPATAAPQAATASAKPNALPSPEQQKQLEKLKGRMAAVKADTGLSESERASRLRDLQNEREKLKLAVPVAVTDASAEYIPSTPTPTAVTGLPSDSDSSPPPDDDLMAGETRQLKSVLKKSKKKPRQKKNIHHNYFMTMRGWRPALVPFPHGLHPKPQEPRNTLWWGNVPKDADHIMATPKIPKEPEALRAGEEADSGPAGVPGEKGDKKLEPSVEDGRKVLEKVDGKIPPVTGDKEAKKVGDVSRGEDKGKVASADRDGRSKEGEDKSSEESKVRAAQKAKEEAKAAAKAKEEKGRAAVPALPTIQMPPAVDPKVQKATWVTQGMLCSLLFFVHEQLAFVVLGFFVWKHVQGSKARAEAMALFSEATAKAAAAVPQAVSARTAQSTRPAISRGQEASKSATEPPASDRPRSSPRQKAEPMLSTDPAASERAAFNSESTNTTKIAIKSEDPNRRVRELSAQESADKAAPEGLKSGPTPSASKVSTTIADSKREVKKGKTKEAIDGALDDHTAVPVPEGAKRPVRRVKDSTACADTPAKLSEMSPDVRAKYERKVAGRKEEGASPPVLGEGGDSKSKAKSTGQERDESAGSSPAPTAGARTKEGTADPNSQQVSGEKGAGGRALKTAPRLETTTRSEKASSAGETKESRVDHSSSASSLPKRSKAEGAQSIQPSPASTEEEARKIAEKAKAARREDRLRQASERGSEKMVSQKSGREQPRREVETAGRLNPGPAARAVESATAKGREGSGSGEKRTKDRRSGGRGVTTSGNEDATVSRGLLVEVDRSSTPSVDGDTAPTPKAEKRDARVGKAPVTPTAEKDGRAAVEKLKDERRSQLLRSRPAVVEQKVKPPLPSPADQDLSPTSVYSQMTELGSEQPSPPDPTPKLTKDVVAARQALAAGDGVRTTRRSSSVGSYGVIRFDGGKEQIPDPPRTAPIGKAPAASTEPDKAKAKRSARDRVDDTVSRQASSAMTSALRVSDGSRAEREGKATTRRSSVEVDKKQSDHQREVAIEAGRERKETGLSGVKAASDRHTADGRRKERRDKYDAASEETGGGPGKASKEEERTDKERRHRREERKGTEKENLKTKLRLMDLTPEQVEQMQKDRERRRVRKAREAKLAIGQGSSGLSVSEKAILPTSP